jgi:hypothetical protein
MGVFGSRSTSSRAGDGDSEQDHQEAMACR